MEHHNFGVWTALAEGMQQESKDLMLSVGSYDWA
jgi:hypothetical protein